MIYINLAEIDWNLGLTRPPRWRGASGCAQRSWGCQGREPWRIRGRCWKEHAFAIFCFRSWFSMAPRKRMTIFGGILFCWVWRSFSWICFWLLFLLFLEPLWPPLLFLLLIAFSVDNAPAFLAFFRLFVLVLLFLCELYCPLLSLLVLLPLRLVCSSWLFSCTFLLLVYCGVLIPIIIRAGSFYCLCCFVLANSGFVCFSHSVFSLHWWLCLGSP